MTLSDAMKNASQRFGTRAAADASSHTTSQSITEQQPSNQPTPSTNTIVARVINQSTPSGSTSDISSIAFLADDQVRHLQMINTRLWYRNNELQDSAARQRQHSGGRGKNATCKNDRSFTMTDSRNKSYVSTWVSNTLMRHVKVLPNKWMKYNDSMKSTCQRIFALNNVTIPFGMDNEKYWNDNLADLTNSVLGVYRSNRVQGHSKQYGGNFFDVVFRTYLFIITNANIRYEKTNTSCFQP